MARNLYIIDDQGQIINLNSKVYLIDSDTPVDDAERLGIRLDNFNMRNCFFGPEDDQ